MDLSVRLELLQTHSYKDLITFLTAEWRASA